MTDELKQRVEYMLARPYPTRKDLEGHCREAIAERYRAILVPTSLAAAAYELIEGSNVKLACAIGFPFGSADPDAKRFETEVAVDSGTHEIEFVPSIGRLVENDY